MDYFDTDVLIHFLINQIPDLHLKSTDLVEESIKQNKFTLSWLSIQETGFVLAKLNQPISFITNSLNSLISPSPMQHGRLEFKRAMELAEIIGFKDFNDCLHTAIAEQHCTDLYTCNYKDFKRIEPHTTLNIHFV